MLRFCSIFVLMFMICFGVKGADISIDGQENFEQLRMPVGQKLRSISLKNLDINEQFWEKWYSFSFDVSDLIVLSFDFCSFEEGEQFEFLAGFSVQTLKMTNCNISDETLSEIMNYAYCGISEMIFSGNCLGKENRTFLSPLRRLKTRGGGLDSIDFSNNFVDPKNEAEIISILSLNTLIL